MKAASKSAWTSDTQPSDLLNPIVSEHRKEAVYVEAQIVFGQSQEHLRALP